MTKSGGCQRSDITELTAVILTVILAEEWEAVWEYYKII